MGEHNRPRRSRIDVAAFGSGVARGAVVGLVVGILFMAVGAVRAVMFLARGGKLSAISADDLRLGAYYVGGFGLAGAVVGGLLRRFPGSLGTYVIFALGGIVVMTAIMAGDKGGLAANDAFDWIVLLALGAGFGLAFGHGWNRRP